MAVQNRGGHRQIILSEDRYLINSTEECQFDVYLEKEKGEEEISTHMTRKKISFDDYLIKQDMYVWVDVRKFAC